MSSLSIPLRVTATTARTDVRRRQPLTGGVPLPRGLTHDDTGWTLRNDAGDVLPADVTVTERWPDGSIRWLLLDTQMDAPAGARAVPLTLEQGAALASPGVRTGDITVTSHGTGIVVDTGIGRWQLSRMATGLLERSETAAGVVVSAATLTVIGEDGQPWAVTWDDLQAESVRPLRTVIAARGHARNAAGTRLSLSMRYEFFAGHGAARVSLVARNARRAEHPGGIWHLGDSGSIVLKELSLAFAHQASAGPLQWSTEPEVLQPAIRAAHVYQDSSGGNNWASTNHVDRQGAVSPRFRGYQVQVDGEVTDGLRAAPTVVAGEGPSTAALAVPGFWENFPRSLSVDAAMLCVSFVPVEAAGGVELQGGEQKTHECFLLCGPDIVDAVPLAWCHSRSVLHADPEWYVQAGAVPFLTRAADEDPRYRALVDAAIDGPDTFVHKREVADEYGWRHFGDIYGDHEGVFHKGPTPLMSHYNNQYDPVGGFLYQFMRTGDPRWWTQCLELASHVVDIDIYHTDEDKAAYNHGLFWHTYHYVDAGKANHRTYPAGTVGGGPSSEQNYPTGLWMHHLVTGDPASREAALGLAQFVIDMDDGRRTIFRWLDRGNTGIASASRTPDYQGPGRGSANSLNALVDGHRISGERRFLDKAEQIIRRVTHPAQNIERLQLLDPENRWFYTMYLQSLAKYLEWKAELGELDAMYAYGRDVLLHFARWMAEHERPYLDRPDLLEYPTETWPAQDIRKSEIFDAAARYADGKEREQFLERAWFFYDYCVRTLSEMPTRTLARPVVLLLVHGNRRAYAAAHGVASAPEPVERWQERWPAPETFVPQKVRAMRKAKLLVAAGGVAGLAVLSAGVWWWLY